MLLMVCDACVFLDAGYDCFDFYLFIFWTAADGCASLEWCSKVTGKSSLSGVVFLIFIFNKKKSGLFKD